MQNLKISSAIPQISSNDSDNITQSNKAEISLATLFFQSLRNLSLVAYDKCKEKAVEKGEPQLKDVLDAWMESTKISITIFGKSNIDQILLINTILEETTKKPTTPGKSTETLWPDIEKQITAPLLYNEKFPSTINWNRENQAKQSILNYSKNNNRNSLDLEFGYILPPNMKDFATSPIICYGEVPEIIISFPKDLEVRNALWEYYLVNTGCKRVDELKKKILASFHNNIFGNQKPYGFVSNAKQIPIPNNFTKVIGKTFSFKGKGDDLNIDRIFIREKLREIAKQYGFLTHNVIVKLPSKLLYGKIELVLADFTDNNETKKWKAMNSLKRSNLIVLTIDETGLCDEYYDLLYKSGFLENFLNGSEEHRLIVSELVERNQLSHSNYNVSTTFQREKFKSDLSKYLKRNLSSSSNLLENFEQNLLNLVTFLPIKPILYSSIFENAKTINSGSQSYDSLLTSGKTTNIPSLVGRFKNMIISQCFLALKDVHNSWMESNPNAPFPNNSSSQQMQPNKTKDITQRDKVINEKIVMHKKNISENVDIWCKQLLEQISVVSKILENNAMNCFQKFSQEWETLKNSKLSNIQSCKQNFSLDEYGRKGEIDFNQLFFSFIISETPVLWNSLFGKLILSVQSLYQFCGSAYQDYLSMISKIQNPERIEKLVKILQGSTERFLKENFTQLEWIIGEKNVKDTLFYWCTKLLNEKVFSPSSQCASVMEYHQLLEKSISELPLEVARNIHQEFSQLIDKVISHLRKIESQILRDIDKCNNLVEINTDNLPNFTSSHSSLVVNNQQSLFNYSSENNLITKLFTKSEWKKTNNDNNMRSFYKQFNLFSVFVKQDTNAQFRAISHQIYGTEEAHGLVRLIVLSELLANPNRYSKCLTKEDEQMDVSESMQQFVSRFDDGTTQIGDYVTLLASVNAYNCTFCVYSPFSSTPVTLKPLPSPNSTKKICNISMINYNVYQSLIPFESLNVDDVLLNPEFVKTPKMERKKRKQRNSTKKSSDRNFVYQESSSDDMAITTKDSGSHNPLSKKRNHLTEEVECEMRRIEKKIKSEKVFLKTRKVPTLKNMCIEIVGQYSSLMPSLEGCLPNELLQKILSLLIVRKTLDAKNFSKYISSSMTSLDLANSDQVDESSCQMISQKCSNLIQISFENCKNLTDEGLKYIANCSAHLKSINLNGCIQVGDLGLQELAKRCPELVSISVEGCKKITDCSLQNLSLSCKKLSACNVSGCVGLTDEAFRFVGTNIEVIDISGCPKVSDMSLFYILKNNQMNIRRIKMSGANMTDKSAEFILSCKNLLCLEITECNFSENSLNLLWRLPLQKLSLPSSKRLSEQSFQHLLREEDSQNNMINSNNNMNNVNMNQQIIPFPNKFSLPSNDNTLLELDFTGCLSFTDRSLQIVSVKCSNLRFLSLKSCEELSDIGVAMLSKCRNLEQLDLSNLKITDDSISSISLNCLKLSKLVLTNCRNVTDVSMKYIGDNLLKLTHLDLCFCHKITDEGLSEIAKGCKELEVIGLEDLIVTDNSVTLLGNSPNLRVLNLAYCKMISDFSIYKLAECCPNVETIDLSYCVGVTISSVQSAISKWENLSSLSIRGNDLLTSQSISHPRLRNLDISWCKYLTDDALILSARNCPMLSSLDLTWCVKLTDNSVKNIVTYCPSIREIKLRGCTSVSFSTIKYLVNIGTICHR